MPKGPSIPVIPFVEGVTKFAAFPLPNRKITPQIATKAPNLITVRTFWRLAPQRVPR